MLITETTQNWPPDSPTRCEWPTPLEKVVTKIESESSINQTTGTLFSYLQEQHIWKIIIGLCEHDRRLEM